MISTRPLWQLVLGWSFVAALALGQGALYGDPSCPNCNRSAGPAGLAGPPIMAGPSLELTPQLPVVHEMAPAEEAPPPEPAVPVVKVRVRAPACAVVGKEMEYRIKVENCSPADAHHVIVRTTVPASVQVVRASPQVHANNPDLQWNLGTLPGFGCHDLVVVVVPIGLSDIKLCTRVQFEYGQCTTTKVMAFAPEGSEEGRGPIPGVPGTGTFPGSTREPGVVDPRRALDVRITGPSEAPVGMPVKYQVTVINRGDRPLYQIGVTLEPDKGLDIVRTSDPLVEVPGASPVWPKGLLVELPPQASKSLELELRANFEGRFCLRVEGSGSIDAKGIATIKTAREELCTVFGKRGVGLTLEMYDLEDPILKDGRTTYPIMVRNQGQAPATNIRVKALVPALLEFEKATAPLGVKFQQRFEGDRSEWIEFDPLPTLAGGETQTYQIAVRARGKEGDARFEVRYTADQLDRGPKGEARWIIEQESTTIVPDEETRLRMISRKKNGSPVGIPVGRTSRPIPVSEAR
jgi:uncharacterized repeat protein (TIGR01451 family)